MISTPKIKRSIKKKSREIESTVVMKMTTLVILNMMIKTLVIDVDVNPLGFSPDLSMRGAG